LGYYLKIIKNVFKVKISCPKRFTICKNSDKIVAVKFGL